MTSSPSEPKFEHLQESPVKPKFKFAVTSLNCMERVEESCAMDSNRSLPLRKDTPAIDRNTCDVKKFAAPEEGVYTFGTHLGSLKSGFRRSSNYSTMSDFSSWTSNSDEPCSSAQAEARLATRREIDCMFSRAGESQCDTGYSSPSTAATTSVFKLKFPAVNCTTDIAGTKSAEELQLAQLKDLDPKQNGYSQQENHDAAVAQKEVSENPEKKVNVDSDEEKKAMEIEADQVIVKVTDLVNEVVVVIKKEKSSEKSKKPKKPEESEKPKKLRPENMPSVPPNYFEGTLYGHLIDIFSCGTQDVLDVYYRNPDKFFKRYKEGFFRRKVMPLLFGKSHKSPADVVKTLREVLIILDKLPPPKLDKDGNVITDKKYDKALDEVSKNVAMIKAFIYGNDSTDPGSDHVVQVAQLAQEVYNANILPMLVKMLPKFEFECKKDVGQIFNNLLRRQIGTRSPTVEYLGARPEILIQLVQGYSVPDIALTCGLMLRESIRHDHLAKIILQSEVFYTFFLYVQSEVFDIASDAFSTFKELTTRHKAISAEFLDANYDTFFSQYQNLLNSKNYVTRRQSLKLLGELLLDRHNFNIMTKYISNPENLKLMMELLRDKSRNIQYEAFHVFKVFVANPNKPRPISDILNRNREKLVEFLGEFHNDRTDDEQFNDEKAYLIKQIQEMKGSPKELKKHKTKEEELQEAAEGQTQPGPSTQGSSGPSVPATSQ